MMRCWLPHTRNRSINKYTKKEEKEEKSTAEHNIIAQGNRKRTE